MRMLLLYIVWAAIAVTVTGCGAKTATPSQDEGSEQRSEVPVFDADSAYAYVKAQTDFGPRVPGTPAHKATAQWLEKKLRATAPDTLILQSFTTRLWNGTTYPLTNLWASYNPRAARRILLVAHWDTRPWADGEADQTLHKQPIDGANDGGSGVGVLLEIARQLSLRRPSTGVDILLVDGEDSGSHADGEDDTWCLGSQHWAGELPYPMDADQPFMGVLLDMVGGQGARFHKEYFSRRMASQAVEAVWKAARKAGYADVFPDATGGAINDDHLPITRAGIPTADVIENCSQATGSFPATWHTLQDNIDNISPASLKAAGQTVLQLIYD